MFACFIVVYMLIFLVLINLSCLHLVPIFIKYMVINPILMIQTDRHTNTQTDTQTENENMNFI